jgi:hypothetical protein
MASGKRGLRISLKIHDQRRRYVESADPAAIVESVRAIEVELLVENVPLQKFMTVGGKAAQARAFRYPAAGRCLGSIRKGLEEIFTPASSRHTTRGG